MLWRANDTLYVTNVSIWQLRLQQLLSFLIIHFKYRIHVEVEKNYVSMFFLHTLKSSDPSCKLPIALIHNILNAKLCGYQLYT